MSSFCATLEHCSLILVQGQFFPYFILTIAGLITVPLSYSLLKPSKGVYTYALAKRKASY